MECLTRITPREQDPFMHIVDQARLRAIEDNTCFFCKRLGVTESDFDDVGQKEIYQEWGVCAGCQKKARCTGVLVYNDPQDGEITVELPAGSPLRKLLGVR